MEENESNTAKFFCESCGKEVKRRDSICPNCGRFFASVKCPACNYTGAESRFKNGCPRCGYAVHRHDRRKDFIKEKSSGATSSRFYDEGLPWWVYLVVFLAFLVVVGMVLFY